MTRYYLDFEKSTLWMLTDKGFFVCIATNPSYKHELGRTILNPILPGSWHPLAGDIKISDIVLS